MRTEALSKAVQCPWCKEMQDHSAEYILSNYPQTDICEYCGKEFTIELVMVYDTDEIKE